MLKNEEIIVRGNEILYASLVSALKCWRYDRRYFAGARGVYDGILLMPYLWQTCLVTNKVPTVASCVAELGERSRAFVYQAHCGLLRELHVALYLALYGQVTKNYARDVYEGVDMTYNGVDIAIRHSGTCSDRIWKERKADKSAGCLVLTAVGKGERIHLVKFKELESLIF